MLEFARVDLGHVSVVALSRFGGVSLPPFAELNLGSYVGDDPSLVAQNWKIVKENFNATGLTVMHAQHGTVVNLAIDSGEAPPGDGLVCTKPKHAIVALSADCVPFALVDPKNQVIAVGHAGWKGVLANLMQVLSDQFTLHGGEIANSTAVIGPAICEKCYEVTSDRVDLFKSKMPAAIADETHLDLATGVATTLKNIGFEVTRMGGCNFENENLFSYRRAEGQPTGRGGLVAIIN